MNGNAKPRELKELIKLKDSEMTPEERLVRYGKGNTDVVLYRKVTQGNRVAVVSRCFKAGESIPPGWEDSPAKCGAPESAPQITPRNEDEFDAIVAEIPASEAPTHQRTDPKRQKV